MNENEKYLANATENGNPNLCWYALIGYFVCGTRSVYIYRCMMCGSGRGDGGSGGDDGKIA